MGGGESYPSPYHQKSTNRTATARKECSRCTEHARVRNTRPRCANHTRKRAVKKHAGTPHSTGQARARCFRIAAARVCRFSAAEGRRQKGSGGFSRAQLQFSEGHSSRSRCKPGGATDVHPLHYFFNVFFEYFFILEFALRCIDYQLYGEYRSI